MNLQDACDHFGVREWGHHATLAIRILRRCTENEQGCWVRDAHRTNGYTYVGLGRRDARQLAHRAMYELLAGDIPEGLQVDHLCRNRACVNFERHLEPVTHQENQRRGETLGGVNERKTHCDHGHEFTPENTRITPKGRRSCRTCERMREAARERDWSNGGKPLR